MTKLALPLVSFKEANRVLLLCQCGLIADLIIQKLEPLPCLKSAWRLERFAALRMLRGEEAWVMSPDERQGNWHLSALQVEGNRYSHI